MRIETVTAHVADDMARIFAPLADRAVPPMPQKEVRSRGRRHSLMLMPMLGAIAAGSAVAVAYGLGTVPPMRASVQPPGKAVRSSPAEPTREAATNGAVRFAALSAVRTPVATMPEVTTPAVTTPAVTTLAATSRTLTQSPSASPPAGTTETIRTQASGIRSDRRSQAPSGEQTVMARPIEERCGPGSPEDHCIYRDVMTADARLRVAYERAADAGVSSSWLASVSRRWERARDQSGDNPDWAIDRYDRLAEALDDERRALR